jgi:hypothetical protein
MESRVESAVHRVSSGRELEMASFHSDLVTWRLRGSGTTKNGESRVRNKVDVDERAMECWVGEESGGQGNRSRKTESVTCITVTYQTPQPTGKE